jgi:hypothetical protein
MGGYFRGVKGNFPKKIKSVVLSCFWSVVADCGDALKCTYQAFIYGELIGIYLFILVLSLNCKS